MAVLEVGNGDDIALEARCCGNSKVSTIAKSEDQLLATRDTRAGSLLRRSRSATNGITVVIQGYGTRLRRGAVRVKRRIRQSDAGVEACLVRNEREEQVALADDDCEQVTRN